MGENPVHRQLRSEANLRLGSVSVQSVASDPGLSSNAGYIREAVGGAFGYDVQRRVGEVSQSAGEATFHRGRSLKQAQLAWHRCMHASASLVQRRGKVESIGGEHRCSAIRCSAIGAAQ